MKGEVYKKNWRHAMGLNLFNEIHVRIAFEQLLFWTTHPEPLQKI